MESDLKGELSEKEFKNLILSKEHLMKKEVKQLEKIAVTLMNISGKI